ncbi:hypothetical protein M8J77_022330 [Diaphorina citri]|nr:hypothetical protein M8J77_022330 [Diaphorina citri]
MEQHETVRPYACPTLWLARSFLATAELGRMSEEHADSQRILLAEALQYYLSP